MIINSYRFGINYTPIYDDVSVIYTLRRPSMTTLWTNAVLKLRRDSDDTTAFVFFDSADIDATITLNSFVSTSSNTTPSTTKLETWIGSSDGFVEEWIGITGDNTIDSDKTAIQTTNATQPLFVNDGKVLLKEGTPYVNFSTSTQWLKANVNTDLNSGNDFTIISNTFSFNATTVQAFLATADANSSRFEMFNDRTATKRIAIIRNDSATNFIDELLVQQNSNAQRYLAVVKDGFDLTAYYDNVLQETETYTGTYTNDALVIGAGQNKTNPLHGGIQEIIIFPSALTS